MFQQTHLPCHHVHPRFICVRFSLMCSSFALVLVVSVLVLGVGLGLMTP